jgi:hypothetical protein
VCGEFSRFRAGSDGLWRMLFNLKTRCNTHTFILCTELHIHDSESSKQFLKLTKDKSRTSQAKA